LTVVLCRCETWSLILREVHRENALENSVLRRTFGQRRDKIAGEWKQLHNKESHNFYSKPNIIRTIKPRSMR
jgi:hypothetical protein